MSETLRRDLIVTSYKLQVICKELVVIYREVSRTDGFVITAYFWIKDQKEK